MGVPSRPLGRPSPDPLKLRAGDANTTEVFLRILYSHVRNYFKRESQVHDVAYDALIELLAKLDDGAMPEQPVFWALTAANNAVRRELTRLRHIAIAYESSLHGGAEQPDPVELYDAREELRRINGLLAKCDEAPYRALVGAAEGLDHNELSEKLGVSPGAARMTLARARADFSEKLTAEEKWAALVGLAKRAGLVNGNRRS